MTMSLRSPGKYFGHWRYYRGGIST